jgi:tetratricopeptide (TPR) repeat protein
MPNPQAEALKSKGNDLFKAGKFADAIAKYKEATAIDPNVASYWSNMAACYEKLSQYDEMAEAARGCIKADKSFVKGYFRLAVAYKNLNDLTNCIKTLESGLAVESSNADLKKMKKEVTELQRSEQVAAFCNKAEELMQNGDVTGAMKQLELASRLCAGNPVIEKMMAKVKPKFDAQEKKRKANMSPVERFKEMGDQSYKNANFEEAVTHYTKCLDQLRKEGKQGSDLALKAYANRAGECWKLSSWGNSSQMGSCSLGWVCFCSPCVRRCSCFVQLAINKFPTLMVSFPIARPFLKSNPTTSRPWFDVHRPSRASNGTGLPSRT